MTKSGILRPVPSALVVFLVSTVPLQSGSVAPPPPPPPVFVTPPTGGVVDPVFVPTPKPAPAPATSGGASDSATKQIVVELDAARNFCRRMPSPEYTIDCLGDALQSVANDIPADGAYSEARSVVSNAARQLRALAQENASSVLPTGRLRSSSDPSLRSLTPLTPVAREKLDQSRARATAILEEAETLLLRSAANSAARKVHYQRISAAVGSNKKLLRST